MLQFLSTLALMVILANGDSPAKRDVYRFVPMTKRPTRRYAQEIARSDRYTARPTQRYGQSAKSDSLLKMFGRRFDIKSDGTKRPTTRRYAEAKKDGWTKYFGKYFTRRPTQRRYDAAATSDSRYRRPTQRPTPRRYGVQADRKSIRPTRIYNVQGDARKTGRPTKPYAMHAEQVTADDKQGVQPETVPEPEVLDKKYFHVKSRLAWNDAQEACARRGAQLATIHSADDHKRVVQACKGECWLGAERGDVVTSFKWADDSAMDFDKWAGTKSGLCAKMSDKKWTSADCDDKLGSVCQKMQWKARVEANVDESDYFTLAASFARGNLLSLALMITVVVVVAFLACNYACVVLNDKKEVDDMNGTSDEATPLLWTRA